MTHDFRNPDFDSIYRERGARLERLRADKDLIPPLKEYYRDNPIQFINDWGFTFDPRNPEIGLPAVMPFILFPKQEEFVTWIIDGWRNRQGGLCEKSRDMGASWVTVAVAVWFWTFHPGTAIGFGSRKEEYVDSSGDPKSLFWKIREFIRLLPPEFKPLGYEQRKHAPFMRITNPENGSFIGGESGDNIGRGARTSIYFVDESAHLERPEIVDAALSQTSNCIYHLSSVNGPGNPFARKRHSGKHRVFTFHWRDDPRKDEAWYRKQQNDLDPIILAQEVDIDYNASMGDAWITGDSISAAQRLGPADVESLGPWRVAVDAAHHGDDESVIHRRKGRLNLPQIIKKGFDGVQLAAEIEQECDRLVWVGGEVFDIVIELDGPGVSCYDQLRKGRYAAKVVGVHTGARTGDDRNYNIRARAWRAARDYLESPPVSLPVCPDLKAQLGSLKYKYKDGLLLMEDKREYKKRNGGRSPDRADGFVLTFANPADPSANSQGRNTNRREHDPYA